MRHLAILALTLAFAGGCSQPQPVPYLLTPGGGGVWIMPKGAKAPVHGYLMDEAGALWLLRPWARGAGVPSIPGWDD